jgi:membrane associated rhomboid family serine protease
MLLIPSSVEPLRGVIPKRATPIVWLWLALVLVVFVCERVVAFDQNLKFGYVPQGLFVGVTFVSASWSLYGDPMLFDIWQLWSHLFVHSHWWILMAEMLVMLVIGRALERTMGSALFAAVLACLGPLGGVLMVLFGHQQIYVGGLPFMLGLIGLTMGRFPGAVMQWGIAWWAIIAVGYWRLFRLPVHIMVFLPLVLIALSAPENPTINILVGLLLLVVGFGFGVLVRRLHPEFSA